MTTPTDRLRYLAGIDVLDSIRHAIYLASLDGLGDLATLEAMERKAEAAVTGKPVPHADIPCLRSFPDDHTAACALLEEIVTWNRQDRPVYEHSNRLVLADLFEDHGWQQQASALRSNMHYIRWENNHTVWAELLDADGSILDCVHIGDVLKFDAMTF